MSTATTTPTATTTTTARAAIAAFLPRPAREAACRAAYPCWLTDDPGGPPLHATTRAGRTPLGVALAALVGEVAPCDPFAHDLVMALDDPAHDRAIALAARAFNDAWDEGRLAAADLPAALGLLARDD